MLFVLHLLPNLCLLADGMHFANRVLFEYFCVNCSNVFLKLILESFLDKVCDLLFVAIEVRMPDSSLDDLDLLPSLPVIDHLLEHHQQPIWRQVNELVFSLAF